MCTALFVGASLTDWLDGYLARKMVSTACTACSSLENMPCILYHTGQQAEDCMHQCQQVLLQWIIKAASIGHHGSMALVSMGRQIASHSQMSYLTCHTKHRTQ